MKNWKPNYAKFSLKLLNVHAVNFIWERNDLPFSRTSFTSMMMVMSIFFIFRTVTSKFFRIKFFVSTMTPPLIHEKWKPDSSVFKHFFKINYPLISLKVGNFHYFMYDILEKASTLNLYIYIHLSTRLIWFITDWNCIPIKWITYSLKCYYAMIFAITTSPILHILENKKLDNQS